jgi:hypothetical protein
MRFVVISKSRTVCESMRSQPFPRRMQRRKTIMATAATKGSRPIGKAFRRESVTDRFSLKIVYQSRPMNSLVCQQSQASLLCPSQYCRASSLLSPTPAAGLSLLWIWIWIWLWLAHMVSTETETETETEVERERRHTYGLPAWSMRISANEYT